MADEKKSTPKASPFIKSLVGDPASPPEVIMLSGYPGDSSEEDHTRLYSDANLSSYVEIPDDAVKHQQAVKGDPLGAVNLWVDRNAELIRKGPRIPDVKARFFSGEIARDHLAEAAAPAGEPVGPTGVQHCTAAPPVCGDTKWKECPDLPGPTGVEACTQAPAVCGNTEWEKCPEPQKTEPAGDCTFFGCQTLTNNCKTIPNGDCTFFGGCPQPGAWNHPTPGTHCFICPPPPGAPYPGNQPTPATDCFICPPPDNPWNNPTPATHCFICPPASAPQVCITQTENPGCTNAGCPGGDRAAAVQAGAPPQQPAAPQAHEGILRTPLVPCDLRTPAAPCDLRTPAAPCDLRTLAPPCNIQTLQGPCTINTIAACPSVADGCPTRVCTIDQLTFRPTPTEPIETPITPHTPVIRPGQGGFTPVAGGGAGQFNALAPGMPAAPPLEAMAAPGGGAQITLLTVQGCPTITMPFPVCGSPVDACPSAMIECPGAPAVGAIPQTMPFPVCGSPVDACPTGLGCPPPGGNTMPLPACGSPVDACPTRLGCLPPGNTMPFPVCGSPVDACPTRLGCLPPGNTMDCPGLPPVSINFNCPGSPVDACPTRINCAFTPACPVPVTAPAPIPPMTFSAFLPCMGHSPVQCPTLFGC